MTISGLCRLGRDESSASEGRNRHYWLLKHRSQLEQQLSPLGRRRLEKTEVKRPL